MCFCWVAESFQPGKQIRDLHSCLNSPSLCLHHSLDRVEPPRERTAKIYTHSGYEKKNKVENMIQVFTAPPDVSGLGVPGRGWPSVWGDAAGVCWAGRATTFLLPGFARHFPRKCCYGLLVPKTSSLMKVKLYVRRLRRSKINYLYISVFNM